MSINDDVKDEYKINVVDEIKSLVNCELQTRINTLNPTIEDKIDSILTFFYACIAMIFAAFHWIIK